MLYTSYFAKVRSLPSSVVPIGISLWPPRWFQGESERRLAPSQSLLTSFKSGLCTEDQYRTFYRSETLDKLNPAELYQTLSAKGVAVALCCYEKPTDFCHRHIVADWFKETLGVTVEEFGSYYPTTDADDPFTKTS